MLTATSKQLRHQHLPELLEHYYKSLTQTIRLCGSDPEKLFTFDQLQQQLKQFSKFGMFMCPLFLIILVPDLSDLEDLTGYLEDYDANTNDAGTMSKLTGDNKQKLMTRVYDALYDGLRYGWK